MRDHVTIHDGKSPAQTRLAALRGKLQAVLPALALTLLCATPAFPLGLERSAVIAPIGTETGLLNPAGFWYDSLRGSFLIANTHARQVTVLNRQGHLLKAVGKNELTFPVAVAADDEGTLFIAERGKESVRAIRTYDAASGHESSLIDLSSYRRSSAVQPVALHLDEDGNLYIVDKGNHQVLVLGRDGKLKLILPDAGDPAAIRVDRSGQILVADPAFGGIRVYNPQGKWLRTLGGNTVQVREPLRVKGMAVDRRGRIWVIEESSQAIKALDSTGNVVVNFKPAPMLASPVDIAIDEQDNLFILEQGANRISVFRITGF